MTAVELARKQLGPMIESLRAIRRQLVDIQESIPPTSQETSPEDLEGELDAPTEIRAILGNAVRDHLDPMIHDLIRWPATAAAHPTVDHPHRTDACEPRLGAERANRGEREIRLSVVGTIRPTAW